jgi:hypothetical protein
MPRKASTRDCWKVRHLQYNNSGHFAAEELLTTHQLVSCSAARRSTFFGNTRRWVLLCCRYLSSSPFSTEQHAGEVVEAAKTGYYGFQDYAAAFWQHHIRSVLESNRAIGSSATSQQLAGPVLDSITVFMRRFGLLSKDEPLSLSSKAVSWHARYHDAGQADDFHQNCHREDEFIQF